MRLRFLSGNRLHASITSSIECLRFTGTSLSRTAVVVAWSDTARFGISVSPASRSSPGTRPTVDRVIRRGETARPFSSASIRSAFIVAS